MQEQLLGYLLGALEDDESRKVAQALQDQPDLQEELHALEASLQPLEVDREPFEPPPGLARKTCQAVSAQAASAQAASVQSAQAATIVKPEAEVSKTPISLSPTYESPSGVNRWSLSDLSVAGGVFLAAGLLLLPALEHSRFVAHRTLCQDNLRQIGQAAIAYSQQHGGYFPQAETEGNLSVAGMFPVRLIDEGYLIDSTPLACPTSEESNRARANLSVRERNARPFVPTVKQLKAVRDPRRLRTWHQTMGGDYAYTLGNMDGAVYAGAKNRNRSCFPIAVDRPIVQSRLTIDRNTPPIALVGNRSANHGGHGQNVLFEDGHVQWTSDCLTSGIHSGAGHSDYAKRDNFFKNEEGNVAAGLHANDAACGASDAHPIPKYLPQFPQ